MVSSLLHDQAASSVRARPDIRTGYTVRVHERIQEGEGSKERIQIFEGLVIAVHAGLTPTDTTFTVRRIASDVGVERIFSLHSPLIEKIEVKKVAKVRRAKLYFLRGRRGKAARLSERFTTAKEFAIAAQAEPKKQETAADESGGEQDTTENVQKTANASASQISEDTSVEPQSEAAETQEKKSEE